MKDGGLRAAARPRRWPWSGRRWRRARTVPPRLSSGGTRGYPEVRGL